jgi:hypothetical protein
MVIISLNVSLPKQSRSRAERRSTGARLCGLAVTALLSVAAGLCEGSPYLDTGVLIASRSGSAHLPEWTDQVAVL